MFGFDVDEDGSEERFATDIVAYDADQRPRAVLFAWWLLHNLVAHPLIGVLPLKPFFSFHDWTSRRMHLRPTAKRCETGAPCTPEMASFNNGTKVLLDAGRHVHTTIFNYCPRCGAKVHG